MRVLLTGAAGQIGTIVLASLANQYEWILTDRRPPANTFGYPFIPADIADLTALRSLCQGIDTVIHLAAMSRPESSWQDLYSPNLLGVYNLFQAASEMGCRRVIFASSLQAVDGYPRDLQIREDAQPNPLTLYGATKAWGEALAAYYAGQKNLSLLCLRLGWVKARNDPILVPNSRHLPYILTHEDLVRLMVACLEAPPGVRFGIFHGVSNNRYKRLDLSKAREVLHYQPQDDAFELARRNYPAMAHQWIARLKRLVNRLFKSQ